MEVLFAIFLFLVLPIVIVVYLVARSSNAKPRSGATFDFDDPPDRRQRTPPRSVSTSPPARHGVFEISVEVVGPGSVRGYRPGAKRDARWLRQGEAISIAGYQITGGMLYVGEALDSVAGYSPEPALIVPSQPVARAHPDRQGQGCPTGPRTAASSPGAAPPTSSGWRRAGEIRTPTSATFSCSSTGSSDARCTRRPRRGRDPADPG